MNNIQYFHCFDLWWYCWLSGFSAYLEEHNEQSSMMNPQLKLFEVVNLLNNYQTEMCKKQRCWKDPCPTCTKWLRKTKKSCDILTINPVSKRIVAAALFQPCLQHKHFRSRWGVEWSKDLGESRESCDSVSGQAALCQCKPVTCLRHSWEAEKHMVYMLKRLLQHSLTRNNHPFSRLWW